MNVSVPLSYELGVRVLFRWVLNSAGLWLATTVIPGVSYSEGLPTLLLIGVILTVINAILKPITTILALPAILLSLGLFTIIVNGLMVFIADKFVASFEIKTFLGAVLAGMIVSLLNYGLTTYLEERIFKENHD